MTLRFTFVTFVSVLAMGISACTAPVNQSDVRTTDAADTPVDVVNICHSDQDCSDGVFCNGAERCMPSGTGANAHGCLPAATSSPCMPTQMCNEAATRCETICPGEPDADHDGHRSITCGGDDCDDADANRFPGNPEVCGFTAAGTGAAHRVGGDHDEDCNPLTLQNATTHDGDHDGDGYVDIFCTNTDSSGTVHAGDDCDDADPQTVSIVGAPMTVQPGNIHPMQPEVCNGVDDNCDGNVDTGLLLPIWVDADHDTYGDSSMTPMQACAVRSGYSDRNGDCADDNPAVHPGVPEVCNGIDDDCNGMIDDATDAACTAMLGNHGPARCFPTATGAACRPTGCTMGFADCDNNAANGCESDTCSDSLQCNHCGGHCSCSGGGCIGLNPTVAVIGTVSRVGGSPVSGATVTPLFGCHAESATTDAMGHFSFISSATGPNLLEVQHSGIHPHVVNSSSYDVISAATLTTWLADPDAPMQDPGRGIVILEITSGVSISFSISSPGGPEQLISGTDVLAPGASGPSTTVVFFNVAPGAVTIAPIVPVGCSACAPVSTWVIPGGISRVVINACFEACA